LLARLIAALELAGNSGVGMARRFKDVIPYWTKVQYTELVLFSNKFELRKSLRIVDLVADWS